MTTPTLKQFIALSAIALALVGCGKSDEADVDATKTTQPTSASGHDDQGKSADDLARLRELADKQDAESDEAKARREKSAAEFVKGAKEPLIQFKY